MRRISFLISAWAFILFAHGQAPSSSKEAPAFINSLVLKNFYGVIQLKTPCGYIYRNIPGMNIEDHYFLSCYHLFLIADTEKFVSMKLYYNKGEREPGMDSLVLIKDVARYKKTLQSKKTYNPSDKSTDYIFIPVPKKITANRLVFDSATLRTGDTTYALASYMDKFMLSRFEVLCEDKACERGDAEYVSLLGTGHCGFPGAPVFNKNGKVIGMNLFGIEKEIEYFFYDKLKANQISFLQYRRIVKQSYGLGAGATCFIKINYLLAKLKQERNNIE